MIEVCPLRCENFRPVRSTAATAVESTLVTTRTTLPITQCACVSGMRGGRLSFYSNGADNETATATIYVIDQIDSYQLVGSELSPAFRCESIGSVALTLGTSIGVAGTGLPTNYRFADTAVWTPSTYGTAMLTYVGGNIAAFSPADNTIAELLISDFGNAQYLGVVFTTYGLTAGRAINALIKADR